MANTNEGTEMKITTINDTKWSMIVFFFIAATIPAASPIGMAANSDIRLICKVTGIRSFMTSNTGTLGRIFMDVPQLSMEEYILQEIAVLLDYGLIKMIFFIQSINNGL